MESSLVHYPVAISHGLRMLQNPSESTFEAILQGQETWIPGASLVVPTWVMKPREIPPHSEDRS